MTSAALELLDSFDRLPEDERRVVAALILRRTMELALGPVADDELTSAADELFLELDAREEADACR